MSGPEGERSGSLADDEFRLRIVRQIEEQILTQTDNLAEILLLLDEYGETLFSKHGHQRRTTNGGMQHEVALSEEELGPFTGRTYLLTHNHPTDSSFTLEDVAVMAFLNVKEGNAFRPDVRYRLIRLVDRWLSLGALVDEFRMLDHEVTMVLGSLVRAGRLRAVVAAAAHLHAVWTRFADRHVGEYAYIREARA